MNSTDSWDTPITAPEECKHPVCEVRIRTYSSNKSSAFFKQCCTCGCAVTSALKKSLFTPEEQAAFKPYDEDLAILYNEQQSIARREQWDKERAEVKKFNQAEYEEYLKTPQWRVKRDAVMRRDNYICQGCLKAPATLVHHKTYSHIYRELLFQLIALCKDFHDIAHDKDKHPND